MFVHEMTEQPRNFISRLLRVLESTGQDGGRDIAALAVTRGGSPGNLGFVIL